MEVALRPRINAPDVVRSALGPREKISENTIDKLLLAPSKILIPERYIPEQAPELSPEEKKRRQEKVESIKKMLSEAPMNSSGNVSFFFLIFYSIYNLNLWINIRHFLLHPFAHFLISFWT